MSKIPFLFVSPFRRRMLAQPMPLFPRGGLIFQSLPCIRGGCGQCMPKRARSSPLDKCIQGISVIFFGSSAQYVCSIGWPSFPAGGGSGIGYFKRLFFHIHSTGSSSKGRAENFSLASARGEDFPPFFPEMLRQGQSWLLRPRVGPSPAQAFPNSRVPAKVTL